MNRKFLSVPQNLWGETNVASREAQSKGKGNNHLPRCGPLKLLQTPTRTNAPWKNFFQAMVWKQKGLKSTQLGGGNSMGGTQTEEGGERGC